MKKRAHSKSPARGRVAELASEAADSSDHSPKRAAASPRSRGRATDAIRPLPPLLVVTGANGFSTIRNNYAIFFPVFAASYPLRECVAFLSSSLNLENQRSQFDLDFLSPHTHVTRD